MTLRLLLLSCLFTSTVQVFDGRKCLTGYMTDVQTWVDQKGDLTMEVEPEVSIDLSSKFNAVRMLRDNLEYFISMENTVKYLSLAKCNLVRIPKVFHFQSMTGDYLSDMIEYMTLYGNSFADTSSAGYQYEMSINATDVTELVGLSQFRDGRKIWSIGFEDVTFKNLKELDLRACSIETIDSHIFKDMPNLEALYLGENKIHEINKNSFERLTNLVHIDLSRSSFPQNEESKLLVIDEDVFYNLKNLRSIDMSYTTIHPRSYRILTRLGPNVQRLSLCWTGLNLYLEGFFTNTNIKYLDLSGNKGVLNGVKTLMGLENSLEVLYATDVRLKTFDVFNNMKKLEILKLNDNDISTIRREVAMTLKNLQVLDLDGNRFGTWLYHIFQEMRNLKLLSLKYNNINVISSEMTNDIRHVNYVALSGNVIVCNCHTKELIERAARNEFTQTAKPIQMLSNNTDHRALVNFNTAITDVNRRIKRRLNISHICDLDNACNYNGVPSIYDKMLLIDYDGHTYTCLQAAEGEPIPFYKVKGCGKKLGAYDVISDWYRGKNLLLLLIIPGVLLPTMLLLFVFRKRVQYFFVAMRNSATLSLISNDEVMDDTKIYNYDVFVSYCHEDRAWMLDQLLPHLETECSVSVCLHERDFQVGLSILENIVSCMDRSRTIMLIISKQFLRSQWCQFEMHLAQHRLLETRREDLTLILLEDIPRRLRPNTLHYLMLTKTYIVWPKEESEQAIFWRRLKKSLVTQKNKLHDNVTLA